MSHPGPVTHAVISLALWPLIIIFSPVIVLAGEPVNRFVMRRVHRSASAAQTAVVRHDGQPARAVAVRLPGRNSLLLAVISNPLWIALTAPGRWVSDRFRRPPASQRSSERALTALLPAAAHSGSLPPFSVRRVDIETFTPRTGSPRKGSRHRHPAVHHRRVPCARSPRVTISGWRANAWSVGSELTALPNAEPVEPGCPWENL